MPNPSYRKGYRLESAVRDDMTNRGYRAERSFMSKGRADVVCSLENWDVRICIQCKADSRKKKGQRVKRGFMGVAEWNAFYDMCIECGDIPVLATGTPAHISYWKLTGRKDGRGGKQPMEPWEPPYM